MKSKNQTNIFIVEDNPIFALALKGYIETAFQNRLIKIYSFETGEKCMQQFAQILPEFVILDYNLNNNSLRAANGLQVLDQIKLINFDTSVIMLTSNHQIEIALKSFHHGASDYILKAESQFKTINESISKIFAQKELAFQNIEKEKHAVDLIMADKELGFQRKEKEKRAAESIIACKLLERQNAEKEKLATGLLIANIQKAEIEKSKLLVEKTVKDITDSINYAKRIQLAKLPRKEDIYAALSQSFILFKPKDIVSGDFYFFHKSTNRFETGKGDVLFIVAADCTGHGVPGAFMSMIGSGKLEEAVAKSTDTSEILKHLNIGIKNSLHQTRGKESTRDGMDIAICSLDLDNRIIKYAGANRPLWLIRKGKSVVEEIKGTKKGIGGFTDENQYFDSHELKLQKGDTFYISTDGYADQFGGSRGKKLLTKRFKEILLEIQHKPMLEQENHLNSFIENWKAGEEQVDDILVIGVRL